MSVREGEMKIVLKRSLEEQDRDRVSRAQGSERGVSVEALRNEVQDD